MSALRPATSTDAPAIATISRTARAEAMPWLPVLHSAAGDLKFFENRVLPKQDVTVADIAGEIAGFISVDGDWVDHLYIAPAHQRKGLGAALLAHAQMSAAYLQLWVFQQNEGAQVFYANHGFQEVERTDGASNEERCPDVRMEWRRGP